MEKFLNILYSTLTWTKIEKSNYVDEHSNIVPEQRVTCFPNNNYVDVILFLASFHRVAELH